MALSKEELKGLYVGQTLCLTEIDSRNNDRVINPKDCTITKIGNKYFYVEDYNERKFYIENGKQENGGYSPSYELFFDLPTYEAEIETQRVWQEYRKLTQHQYNKPAHLTTDQVNQLIDILTPPTE